MVVLFIVSSQNKQNEVSVLFKNIYIYTHTYNLEMLMYEVISNMLDV